MRNVRFAKKRYKLVDLDVGQGTQDLRVLKASVLCCIGIRLIYVSRKIVEKHTIQLLK